MAQPANAQQGRPLIGANIGAYFPTNGKTREVFGNQFLNYGFALGRVQRPGVRGRTAIDFAVITNGNLFRDSDRRAIIIPVGLTYLAPLRELSSSDYSQRYSFLPYYGVSGNVFGTFIRSDVDGVQNGLRMSYGGSAFIGAALGNNFFTQVRYYLMTEVRGFELSGWNISAGFRF
jgi:hypothetical protein